MLRFLTNCKNTEFGYYQEAAAVTGCKVEWRKKPHATPGNEKYWAQERGYGSVWTDERDLTRFWRVVEAIKKEVPK